jgi:predicted RNA-binding Zn-ribbon protein involved in translation (DUF1610 family)
MAVLVPDAILASHHARCGFCGTTEPLPTDLDERVRSLRVRLAEIRFAEQIEEAPALGLARAIETWRSMSAPMLGGLSALFVLGGVASVASLVGRAVSPAVLLQVALYPVSGLVLLLGGWLGSLYALRAYGRELRPRLEARAPLSDGAALRCRACGGDLPSGGREGILACPYCGADNIVHAEIARERLARLEREKEAWAERLAGHRVRFDTATRAYLRRVYGVMALAVLAALATLLGAGLVATLAHAP